MAVLPPDSPGESTAEPVAEPSSTPSFAGPSTGSSPVVPLNQAAAVYHALASGIRGAAVGWTPEAVDLLEDGLRQRYGHLLGGERPIRRLVELATRSDAA